MRQNNVQSFPLPWESSGAQSEDSGETASV
jgi:hypothetical protein